MRHGVITWSLAAIVALLVVTSFTAISIQHLRVDRIEAELRQPGPMRS